MKILITHKVEKYLSKQYKGDCKGIRAVYIFLDELENVQNPSTLSNAKKLQGVYKAKGNFWRWRIGNYRIIGDIKEEELIIEIIEISTRQNAY